LYCLSFYCPLYCVLQWAIEGQTLQWAIDKR
jgi:hypothetical protein